MTIIIDTERPEATHNRRVQIREMYDVQRGTYPEIVRAITTSEGTTLTCTAERNERGDWEHDGESCPIHEPTDVGAKS